MLGSIGREARELAVAQHHHIARGVDNGNDVGANIAAVLAPADDDGAVLARDHDGPGIVGTHHRQTISAHDVRARLAHRGQQIAPRTGAALVAMDSFFNKMRNHLGVGVALEIVAKPLQALAQLGEVLDDAVMHHGDAPIT